MATFQRLSLVLVTTLVLDIVPCPAGLAVGQTGDWRKRTGNEDEGAVAGPGVALRKLIPVPYLTHQALPGQNDQHSSASSDTRDSATAGKERRAKQTKRILYIVPNFRAVSADQQLPPQTVKDKFTTAALDSVDYSSFIFVAIPAGSRRHAIPLLNFSRAGLAMEGITGTPMPTT